LVVERHCLQLHNAGRHKIFKKFKNLKIFQGSMPWVARSSVWTLPHVLFQQVRIKTDEERGIHL